ncbi:hypothetical protein H310_09213 [Aphanomyces invadans]|uniref:Uncharacterized protein n=1 Tax=Aphanomyces invadans TaxID=157072 RepID=A0A024TX57_9STRA|nr:hypothetical protein H310_09213 [Aphanomyces invadans]ETV97892.1 hypothetical protein H310_09213 [Aphanomyces invadans]|eukprot:XP_008873453.1 hypothetical protein H310_09213 [Aphanomyces invadans]
MSANRIVTKQTEWLYEAAAEGATERVKQLLNDKNADVNFHQRAQYGSTPLIAAIVGGHMETAQALLEGGADISALRTPDANSPLHEASFRKNPGMVRLLLQYKDQHTEEDLNDKAKDPRRATGQSSWSMINAKNQFGNTPLHAAAMAGCAATVHVLLDNGATVDELNNQQSTPLHHACYCIHDNTDVVSALIRAGANVNAQDKNHSTPLIVAAKKNQVGAVSLLLKAGANPAVKDDSNRNAYASAALRNHVRAMELLEGLAPKEDPIESPRTSRGPLSSEIQV